MVVLFFDNENNCFASLSKENASVALMKKVKSLGGSFLHVPMEFSAMISGKDETQALNSILKDLGNL